MGYLPGMWRDFGVTVAGLAGALTGLLFVAVSIKSDALAQSRSLSSRAAQTLVLFMTSAIVAILLVAPQPRLALGLELLAAAVICGTALFIFDRRAGHDPKSRVSRYIERASPNLCRNINKVRNRPENGRKCLLATRTPLSGSSDPAASTGRTAVTLRSRPRAARPAPSRPPGPAWQEAR